MFHIYSCCHKCTLVNSCLRYAIALNATVNSVQCSITLDTAGTAT
uniref:Uncharacterized protein n=1 Tax=Anguilla anguilla TaxID=7936 RepID=A0A0E9U237_ANGAN